MALIPTSPAYFGLQDIVALESASIDVSKLRLIHFKRPLINGEKTDHPSPKLAGIFIVCDDLYSSINSSCESHP
jgi:hypothetical protein